MMSTMIRPPMKGETLVQMHVGIATLQFLQTLDRDNKSVHTFADNAVQDFLEVSKGKTKAPVSTIQQSVGVSFCLSKKAMDALKAATEIINSGAQENTITQEDTLSLALGFAIANKRGEVAAKHTPAKPSRARPREFAMAG